MRIGIGEYDPGNIGKWKAQRLFLEAIRKEAPQVLKALKEDVLPKCPSTKTVKNLRWFTIKRDRQYNRQYSELRDALLFWADRFNLREEWILEIALKTVMLWRSAKSQAEIEPLHWFIPGVGYWGVVSDEDAAIKFSRSGWDPIAETRTTFKKRMMADFESFLENYLDKLDAIVQERGLKKTPKKNENEHFTWLAKWYVGNYNSFGEIARAVNVERQSATLGIQKAAAMCGLPVPKGKRGRPGVAGIPACRKRGSY